MEKQAIGHQVRGTRPVVVGSSVARHHSSPSRLRHGRIGSGRSEHDERVVAPLDLILIPPRNRSGFRVARPLALLLADRLRTLSGVSVAVGSDVASYYYGEISTDTFVVQRRRHYLRHYWDGLAIASFTILDPRRKTIVFHKQVLERVSRRRRHSSRAELVRLLLKQTASTEADRERLGFGVFIDPLYAA